MKSEDWDLIIKSKRGLWDIGLADVWRYRDLLVLFVRRDIIAFYKQTILGPLWFFIQPLFTMAVYVFVFTNLAGLSTGGLPPSLFYLTGITFWGYFSGTLLRTSTILKDNVNIFGKVYFPRIIMPLSVIFSGMFRFFIQLLLLLIVATYFATGEFEWQVSWYVLLTPIMILLLALQGLGFGMLVSSMTTKYRDLAMLLSFAIQLLMYATPVVYPLDSLSGMMHKVVAANPVSYLFEGFRKCLFDAGDFDLAKLGIASFVTILVVLLGLVVFNRVERDFVDTV